MKRTPIKRYRYKARPGRLKGEELKELRRQCFERDSFRCVDCGHGVTWETGHLAHIGARRRYGDHLGNVKTSCGACHIAYHAYGPSGVKPVPAKEKQ